MYSIISIISVVIATITLTITLNYINEPFKLFKDKSSVVEINQHYIDFGFIINSSLNNNFIDLNDIKEFNGRLPNLNGIEYKLINTKNEIVIYNENISNNDCLEVENQNEVKLDIKDISINIDLLEYIEISRNKSCYKNLRNDKNYLVFIYSKIIG